MIDYVLGFACLALVVVLLTILWCQIKQHKSEEQYKQARKEREAYQREQWKKREEQRRVVLHQATPTSSRRPKNDTGSHTFYDPTPLTYIDDTPSRSYGGGYDGCYSSSDSGSSSSDSGGGYSSCD